MESPNKKKMRKRIKLDLCLIALFLLAATGKAQTLVCDSSYLNVLAPYSAVQIGDLTITGNQLTIEAVINRTQPYTGSYLYEGDIVSKHSIPSDVNYLLRPSDAEITTTSGYFSTKATCPFELNKTYHVAMVYDGSTLSFYRNGFLMSSVPANGNLINNSWLTKIGTCAKIDTLAPDESFLGYINEVRIWNVARTQAEIKAYMTTSLPNPASQTGLQAYYRFNSLTNLQGNPAWNGVIVGLADTSQFNPTCSSYVADSCGIIVKQIIPTVSFSAPDTVCLNAPVTITNTSTNQTTNYWNFCSADISGTVSPLSFAQYCSSTTVNFLSSSSLTPPQIIYSTPGTYNLCLTIDEGLPTETSVCQQIVVLPPATDLDFGFVQNNCNPLEVSLVNKSSPLAGYNFVWGFGDGNTSTATNATHIYPSLNDYTISLTNTNGCADTIRKTIPVQINVDSLIITNDTTICNSGGLQLRAINAINYCWSPSISLSDSSVQNPVATPKVTTTYYLNSQLIGGNLVVNGDFSAGNTGFTSTYTDSINGYHVGTYTVDTTAAVWHPFIAHCHDHTTGTGKMLIANGSPMQGAAVWQQTINNLQPNTNYIFSTWLQSLSIANPAQIQFYVNGQPTGDTFNAILDTCVWQQPLTTWNSGSNTSAVIAIVDQDTIGAGNDFALDDIAFYPITLKRDSVIITIKTPPSTQTVDTSICLGQSVQLVAAPAASYKWAASSSLSNDTIQNPIATPTSTTLFTVNRYTDSGCYATDTFLVAVSTQKPLLDFSFTEDICSPLSIKFKNESAGSFSYAWNFGNNTTSTDTNPALVYAGYGTYKVSLQNTNGCIDSVAKLITFGLVSDSVITTKNNVFCPGDSLQLNTIPALAYCWSPATGLSSYSIGNPIATPTVPTTYYVNAQVPETNLVVNGDFSQGNVGFTSQYTYDPTSGIPAGVYWVGPSPHISNTNYWHPSFSPCTPVNGGANMMMVNGASTPGVIVWEEKVAITQNTNYAFSLWAESISGSNPAALQFTINGRTIGNVFTAIEPTCIWNQFYVLWNSGMDTTADLTIINLNTQGGGNDFALDDISFAKFIIKTDSINVKIGTAPTVKIINNDTSICQNDSFLIIATGAATYKWSPSAYLSNLTIYNPVAAPLQPTSFIVKGYDSLGCFGLDTLKVRVNPIPTISLTQDTGICKGDSIVLVANSPTASIYSWAAQTGLSAYNIPNPTAKPVDTATYVLTVLDSHSCRASDSVTIAVRPLPVVSTRTDTSICLNTTIVLQTITSNTNHVIWSPTVGLSDSMDISPVDTAVVLAATKYVVTAYSNQGCTATSVVTITSMPLPTINIAQDSLQICVGKKVQIAITESNTQNYLWYPSAGLSSTKVASPYASPDTSTHYYLIATASDKCTATDSVYVTVKPLPLFSATPADSMICKGDSLVLTVSGGDKYQWVPASSFAAPDSSSNWVRPTATTTYKVLATDTLCVLTEPILIKVTVNDPPTVSISKSNDINCIDTKAQLTATGAATYQWSPADSLLYPNTATPVAIPYQTTVYKLKAFSVYGCETDTSIRVNVTKNNPDEGYLVPTAFSPNNSGKNECFGVRKWNEWGYVASIKMNLYNRYGQIIFSSTDREACWDGTFNGIPQPVGTYVYEIWATTICGEVYRKGAFVLIR